MGNQNQFAGIHRIMETNFRAYNMLICMKKNKF